MRKRLLFVLITIPLITLLPMAISAGGQAEEEVETVDLTFATWYVWEELIDAVERGIERAEADNPNWNVTLEQIPNEVYYEDLTAQFIDGRGPDLFNMSVSILADWGPQGILVDLTDYIEADPDVDWDGFSSGAVEAATYDGQVLQFPYGFAISTFSYNKDMFDEAGLDYPDEDFTWDDLLRKADALTVREGGDIVRYGFGIPLLHHHHGGGVPNFIVQNGGHTVDFERRSAAFDSPEAVEAVEFVRSLAIDHQVMAPPSFMDGFENAFIAERVAMYQHGQWEIPDIVANAPFEWDVAPLPAGRHRMAIGDVGGAGTSIAATSPHPDEAWELAQYIHEELSLMTAESGGEIPVDPRYVDAYVEATGPPESRHHSLRMAAEHSIPRPQVPAYRRWREVFNDALVLLLEGELDDVEAALRDAAQQTNRMLEDEGWR